MYTSGSIYKKKKWHKIQELYHICAWSFHCHFWANFHGHYWSRRPTSISFGIHIFLAKIKSSRTCTRKLSYAETKLMSRNEKMTLRCALNAEHSDKLMLQYSQQQIFKYWHDCLSSVNRKIFLYINTRCKIYLSQSRLKNYKLSAIFFEQDKFFTGWPILHVYI